MVLWLIAPYCRHGWEEDDVNEDDEDGNDGNDAEDEEEDDDDLMSYLRTAN